MEIAETIQPVAAHQRAHRSRVSNGTRLFAIAGIDGRSMTARRYRDLTEFMTNDLGGADILSEFQKQLIRRAAALSIMAESVEADVVRDLAFDVNTYGTVCDRLRRIAETLGLQRVPRPVNDGSGAIVDYFRQPPSRGAPA